MKSKTLRVLLALDGSPSAMAVARCWSSWESGQVSLEVSLLNITDKPPASAGHDPALPPLADRLATARAWFAQAGLVCEWIVVDGGNPATVIIEEAQRRQVDLIAMGTRGLSPLRGLLLGSVTAQVSRSSPIPIWTMGPHAAIPGALGKQLRLLLAVDGSAHAAHAAAWVANMADYLGDTSIALLTVQPAFSPIEIMLDAAAGDLRHWGQSVGEAAIATAREHFEAAGHPTTASIVTGNADTMILAQAEANDADVIVVAPQGSNALEQAVLGPGPDRAARFESSEFARPQYFDLGQARHHGVVRVVPLLQVRQQASACGRAQMISMRMFLDSSQAASRTPRLPLPRASEMV
jgi:nucleotide-binding universal stress UspA family protein